MEVQMKVVNIMEDVVIVLIPFVVAVNAMILVVMTGVSLLVVLKDQQQQEKGLVNLVA
jgi:hypothetical protein